MNSIALCIPAYNAEWCLPNLLKSAKEQAFSFDEILVYDDFSTDNTQKIAEEYGAIVVRGESNLGCSTGKNRLAEVAKSTYIHFHDADDLLLPNFLNTMKPWLNLTEQVDIVLLNYDYIDFETNEKLGAANLNRQLLKDDLTKFVLTHKLVNFALIKRESFLKIGGFNTDPLVLFNEDRAFYSRALVNGLTFDYEDEITCINYRYTKSMSRSNVLKCSLSHFHVSEYLKQNIAPQYASNLAQNYLDNAQTAANYLDWDLTKRSLDVVQKLSPQTKPQGSNAFKLLYSLNPYLAYWLREYFIRIFKPSLRKN